ncbi:hypothetical protein [Rubritalea sp.]|uniref:hypothetical protein n=1 Tax=Rubritalea sp. TaxID=2109375 RepID=UPI003EF96CEC
MKIFKTPQSDIGISVDPYKEEHKLVLYLLDEHPEKERLISFAEKRHGYGSGNSDSGITYPGDLDEYDKEQGIHIEDGYVGIYHGMMGWEFHIPEVDYLELLRLYYSLLSLSSCERQTAELINRLA